MDDLSARLREADRLARAGLSAYEIENLPPTLHAEAADALDSLTRERDELAATVDGLRRVLYHVVRLYQQAEELGGDSELLRSAIYDVAIRTLKDQGHWPDTEEVGDRGE